MNIAGDREQKLRNSRSDFRDPKMVCRRHELGPYRDFKVALRGLKKKKYNRALYKQALPAPSGFASRGVLRSFAHAADPYII